ncbi:N-acetylmuramoyl-L-alanine amidase-like domain-containing protein [Bacteroides sp. 224]|uniref:N-acetylmuramoyl-L-alanine amidase-like domain-containing protein n=1 Tax=Bacteroides sp. 224 TaxID=2302936 RepID=UPI0013D165FC|nr:N-acetylmuramoyl-L-alanine amidase-like domain-containing protein [Bacteroides sp. 224]NDV64324.1 DUF1460 domain-containing protein [Bacteroides sp. 224]
MRKITLLLIACALSTITFAQESYNLMLSNALKYVGTPYVANTLEVTDEEELIINGDELDCTTFVEFALAMSLCPEQGDDMQESDFAKNLQNIRYRNGKIEGYTSRLHYASDWAKDNVRMGIIEDITATYSPTKKKVTVSYMSTHPEQYKHLRNSPGNVNKIVAIERELSSQSFFYLPKDQLPVEGLKWIKNGDIIMLTTDIPGLDVSHIGIAIYIKGNLHLLHASSKEGKVVVDKLSLNRQLARSKNQTGIRVFRLKK